MYAVYIEDLRKRFGDFEALKGVNLRVAPGEVYGLIGPNGAGKTTTLRIVATLLIPTSGKVEVFGYDVVSQASEVRRIISYLPEEAGAYRRLTGLEYLRFMASFYAKDGEELERMVEEGARISGLGGKLKEKISNYSKGMKQRLLVARALMCHPRLAILDEPTGGLDVVHAHHIRRIIKEYASAHGTTVLLSSHNMLEVEYLCDRVGIIDNGVVLVEGTSEELKERYDAENLEEVFVKVAGGA
ncbi:MAG: ABC transporter ATP-binding protein [Candidatus Verstraetearchaeota archaeon]|nr:ABC transporter ATP-binding protein [Candidatus Verstraetearchaeota archaeon]